MNCRKVSNQALIITAVLLYFVGFSEQQFSYSANWGKRSNEENVENKCVSILSLKSYLLDVIPNLEQEIIVIQK
ncbi:hypothetical protein BpHYR1_044202 [Brachionus plicatilis]|uniref:Uncharacterized protein n=1 Tax=Brachionus plicatilis TaxID=10195 RepID=A0A3M7PAR7_BRAPC|nr:hypothetical protein BpHYR1_044202 [Brachionus plicatilis]